MRLALEHLSYADLRRSPATWALGCCPVFVTAGSCQPEIPLLVWREDGPFLQELLPGFALPPKAPVDTAGRSIPDLFAAEGEDGFRAREAEQTARFAREGRQVLSCGGGVVKRPENLRALRQNGVVLFIDRPLDALTVGGGRPLSTSAEALKTMEAQRRPLYLAAADAVIPNETTVADAVAAALEALDAIFVH